MPKKKPLPGRKLPKAEIPLEGVPARKEGLARQLNLQQTGKADTHPVPLEIRREVEADKKAGRIRSEDRSDMSPEELERGSSRTALENQLNVVKEQRKKQGRGDPKDVKRLREARERYLRALKGKRK